MLFGDFDPWALTCWWASGTTSSLVVTGARDAFLTKRVGDLVLLMGVLAYLSPGPYLGLPGVGGLGPDR